MGSRMKNFRFEDLDTAKDEAQNIFEAHVNSLLAPASASELDLAALAADLRTTAGYYARGEPDGSLLLRALVLRVERAAAA